ncbi:tripeptidyl-peptidase [Aureococcus anophagefferens]|nr:tripeptidyl-peptidase [Aureococcus anophagefferens]
MKGWQAAAGFLGVGTVISLLSLIGDTTSYDETKYKVAGHWADTTTETATVGGKRSKQASSDDGDDFVGENDGGTKLPPNAPSFKSKQGAGRRTAAATVGENDGGTKLPPNAPSFKSKQGRSTDDEGDDFVGENDGGTKLPPNAPSLESKRGGRSAGDDGAFAGENDGGSKVPPAIHHLLDTAYLDELPSATTQQQNILLILADDMGYGVGYQSTDLGAATPTLDSLASRGVELASYYTLPSCTPARSSLFTANYAANNGMGYDGPGTYVIDSSYGLPLGATLMSEVLKGRGYATHIVGKWNLGHASEAYLPHRRGFDSFIGYVGDQETYFSHEAYGTDPNNGTSYCDLMRSNSVDGVKVGECYLDEYSTDLYARRLVDVVGEHATTSDSPLFLYFAAQAPTRPRGAAADEATAREEAMLAALVGAGDSWGKRRTFAKMVMNLDNNVRKVVDALAAAKLLQNTKRGAGTVFEGLFHVADWFPTLVASAGVRATVGKIDGVNQYDALFDATQNAPRDEVLIHLNKWTPDEDHAAVTAFDAAPAALRWKHWKLIVNEGPMVVNTPAMNASWCACSLTARSSTSYLFNLANDKNESVDVRSDRPDIYAKMVAKLRVYYDDAAKSAWKPEGKEAAYANWRAADNFVVPWVGNVSLTLADSPDKHVFTHA